MQVKKFGKKRKRGMLYYYIEQDGRSLYMEIQDFINHSATCIRLTSKIYL